MSRFNIRPIGLTPVEALMIPRDKKPSAYMAMKSGGSIAAPPMLAPPPEEKKKGRPTKDELRRRKLDMASAGISALVSAKPTRAKIHKYFEERIAQLDEEKR
jgi:hypothetical protein